MAPTARASPDRRSGSAGRPLGRHADSWGNPQPVAARHVARRWKRPLDEPWPSRRHALPGPYSVLNPRGPSPTRRASRPRRDAFTDALLDPPGASPDPCAFGSPGPSRPNAVPGSRDFSDPRGPSRPPRALPRPRDLHRPASWPTPTRPVPDPLFLRCRRPREGAQCGIRPMRLSSCAPPGRSVDRRRPWARGAKRVAVRARSRRRSAGGHPGWRTR